MIGMPTVRMGVKLVLVISLLFFAAGIGNVISDITPIDTTVVKPGCVFCVFHCIYLCMHVFRSVSVDISVIRAPLS